MTVWIGEPPFSVETHNFHHMSRREIEATINPPYTLETVIVDSDGGYEVTPEVQAWLEKKFTEYFEKELLGGTPTPVLTSQPHCGCYGILHRPNCKHWNFIS